MFRDKKYVHFTYWTVDILLIGLSFYLPYYLRYNRSLIINNFPYFRDYFLLFSIWGLSLIFFLNNHALYATDRSLTIPKETWRVIKCVIFSSVLAGLAIFLLRMVMFSRLVFGSSSILLILSLSLWRVVKRILIRYRITKGHYNINVLIAGAGSAGCALAEEMRSNPYLGFKVVGFVDDIKVGKVLNYDILGKINDLKDLIQQYFVDEIYVTIPSERKRVSEILTLGVKMKKTVRVVADSFTFPFTQMKLNYIGLIPLIRYIDGGEHGTEMFIKRFSDVLGAGVGLILFAPIFAFIAFLIKLDSPGPIFYISKRCGKKGRLFDFYKFRSMVMNADGHKEALRSKSEVKGPVFKIKNDPRITGFGRLLRRYSLDELPQLINVVKGDMSLVGTRPPTPDEMAKYDIWQRRRLDIKPGITCLWQIRGRSELGFYKWMKWDLWYIDNWSFGLDLLILLWTIPAVLKKKGAY
ncbi:MAG: sugar transferase [Candidatus Omnitrophica bacterium]|nr:sugar transferase [Candidatus Omnitrophota bacterium]